MEGICLLEYALLYYRVILWTSIVIQLKTGPICYCRPVENWSTLLLLSNRKLVHFRIVVQLKTGPLSDCTVYINI